VYCSPGERAEERPQQGGLGKVWKKKKTQARQRFGELTKGKKKKKSLLKTSGGGGRYKESSGMGAVAVLKGEGSLRVKLGGKRFAYLNDVSGGEKKGPQGCRPGA